MNSVSRSLPYAGANRVRFQGLISASGERFSKPSYGRGTPSELDEIVGPRREAASAYFLNSPASKRFQKSEGRMILSAGMPSKNSKPISAIVGISRTASRPFSIFHG